MCDHHKCTDARELAVKSGSQFSCPHIALVEAFSPGLHNESYRTR